MVVIICAIGQLRLEGTEGGSANSERARTSVSPLAVVVTTRGSSVVICHDGAAALGVVVDRRCEAIYDAQARGKAALDGVALNRLRDQGVTRYLPKRLSCHQMNVPDLNPGKAVP